MCIQHCGDNGFTSIKTCLFHCFVYTLVRNRPRKWIEDNMSQRRCDFFILNENPTQCRILADFVNPLPGGGGILIHSLTQVTPPPPPPRPTPKMYIFAYIFMCGCACLLVCLCHVCTRACVLVYAARLTCKTAPPPPPHTHTHTHT